MEDAQLLLSHLQKVSMSFDELNDLFPGKNDKYKKSKTWCALVVLMENLLVFQTTATGKRIGYTGKFTITDKGIYIAKRINYAQLPESEKIPLRIEAAEQWALEELQNGTDMESCMHRLVEQEQYCGAEGIRRALTKRERWKTKRY